MGDVNLAETSKEMSDLYGNAKQESIELESGTTINVTPAQKVYLYLLAQDAEGREALKDTKGLFVTQAKKTLRRSAMREYRGGFTEGDLKAIEEGLTLEELRVAKAIQRTMNGEIRDAFNEYSMDLYNFEMGRKDNYMTIFRSGDDTRSGAEESLAKAMASPDPLLNASITKERVQNKHRMIIPDVFQVFGNHVNQVAALRGYGRTMKNITSMINDPDIINSIKGNFGSHAYKKLKGYIDAVRGGVRKNPDEGVFAGLRQNYTIGTLSLRPMTWAAQLLSYQNAWTEISGESLARAAVERIAQQGDDIVNSMLEESQYLSDRFSQFKIDRDLGSLSVHDEVKQALGQGLSLRELLGAGIAKFDKMAVKSIMLASHYDAQQKLGPGADPQQVQAYAIKLAERTVRRTQPTFDPMDRTALGATKSEILKWMTMFRSYRNKALVNISINSRKGPAALSKAIATSLLSGTAMNVMRLALWRAATGKKDDKEALDYAKQWMLDIFGMFPLVGDFIKKVFSTFPGDDAVNMPVVDALNDSAGAIRDLGEALMKDKKRTKKLQSGVKKLIKASRLSGIPVEGAVQLYKDIEGISGHFEQGGSPRRNGRRRYTPKY
jgi:hypothetical protein